MPGDSLVTLLVGITVPLGWHIGAKEPGGTGLPTELEWRLPPHWRLLDEQWPKPKTERLEKLVYYTYNGNVNIGASFARVRTNPREPVEVVLSYGMCKDICVPVRAMLKYPSR